MKKALFYTFVTCCTALVCFCGLYQYANVEVFDLIRVQNTEEYQNAAKRTFLPLFSDIVFKRVKFSREHYITFAFHASSVTPLTGEEGRVYIHWNLFGSMAFIPAWIEEEGYVGCRVRSKLNR